MFLPAAKPEHPRPWLRGRSRIRSRSWGSVRVVEVHAREQGMGSAIEEFERNVSTHICQQAVVAHPECVPGVVTPWIPRIHGSHGSGIRRDQCGERKGAMAVFAAAS